MQHPDTVWYKYRSEGVAFGFVLNKRASACVSSERDDLLSELSERLQHRMTDVTQGP